MVFFIAEYVKYDMNAANVEFLPNNGLLFFI